MFLLIDFSSIQLCQVKKECQTKPNRWLKDLENKSWKKPVNFVKFFFRFLMLLNLGIFGVLKMIEKIKQIAFYLQHQIRFEKFSGQGTNVEDNNVENRKILTSKIVLFLNTVIILFLTSIYSIFFEFFAKHSRKWPNDNKIEIFSKKIIYIVFKNNTKMAFRKNITFDVSIFLFSTLLSSTLVTSPDKIS